jgi:hypothetical protein
MNMGAILGSSTLLQPPPPSKLSPLLISIESDGCRRQEEFPNFSDWVQPIFLGVAVHCVSSAPAGHSVKSVRIGWETAIQSGFLRKRHPAAVHSHPKRSWLHPPIFSKAPFLTTQLHATARKCACARAMSSRNFIVTSQRSRTQIVAIGKAINAQELNNKFDACLEHGL